MIRSLFFACLVFIASSPLVAAPKLAANVKGMDFGFIAPNEFYPARSVEHLQDIQEGMLISVGTERALMTAILNKKITSILQVDYDERVVRYNRINLQLLKLSRDRKDYLYLRMYAGLDDWTERATSAGLDSSFSKYFAWWHEALSNSRFFGFHTNWTMKSVYHIPFAGAHYLFDDAAFDYIHRFALEGRIQIRQSDIANNRDMRSLLDSIHVPISVFDVSNAWQDTYAGPVAIYDLSRLVARRNPKAKFLTTTPTKTDWIYSSFMAGDFSVDGAAPHRGVAKILVNAVRTTCNYILGSDQ